MNTTVEWFPPKPTPCTTSKSLWTQIKFELCAESFRIVTVFALPRGVLFSHSLNTARHCTRIMRFFAYFFLLFLLLSLSLFYFVECYSLSSPFVSKSNPFTAAFIPLALNLQLAPLWIAQRSPHDSSNNMLLSMTTAHRHLQTFAREYSNFSSIFHLIIETLPSVFSPVNCTMLHAAAVVVTINIAVDNVIRKWNSVKLLNSLQSTGFSNHN